MNIQSTASRPQATSAQQPQQAKANATSSKTEVAVYQSENSRDSFVSGAVRTGVGALEGAGLALMTNFGGFAATTVGYSVGGAVSGTLGGYRSGKNLEEKIENLGVSKSDIPKFARTEAFKGGLGGFSDNFTKAALISGATVFSGGNVLVGTAMGAVLGAIDLF